MKARCYNPSAASFYMYGAVGVKVCDRWLHSFKNFLADMGEKPQGLTLDRIDGSKGYSPDNCRWADWFVQAKNQKKRKLKEFCKNGHSFSEENTYIHPKRGFRHCKPCIQERNAARKRGKINGS